MINILMNKSLITGISYENLRLTRFFYYANILGEVGILTIYVIHVQTKIMAIFQDSGLCKSDPALGQPFFSCKIVKAGL